MPVAEQEQRTLECPLTTTQRRFTESDAPIVFLIGPEGEGKTYAGLIALIRHAQERLNDPEPVRAALIRDTFENILTKTRPSINKAIGTLARKNNAPQIYSMFEWHRGGKELHIPSLGVIVDLFGADDNASVARLQGGEWSFIWLEEPAPMYRGNNAGLPRSVFDAAVSRAARGGGSMRLQVTMNPADEDHWTFEVAISDPIMRPPDTPDIWTDVYRIPYGENPARTDRQRQATKAAYKNDPALFARLVEGKFAFVQIGEQVTPEYKDMVEGHPHHFLGRPIQVIPGATGFRSWDGGHNPTCLIGQRTPSGRLHFIHGVTLPHVGMKQLIELEVIPLLNQYYREVTDWVDTGDPSLVSGDDSDIEKSPAGTIQTMLHTTYEPAEHWPAVKEPMKAALNLTVDGLPYVRIGKDCEILHKALRGGWHYLKMNNGTVIKTKPVKDIHSHPGDCFGAICLKLLGTKQSDNRPKPKKTSTKSYGP